MALNDHPISGALARAAERWQRAFLVDVAGISEALAMRLPRDVPTPAPPSVR